MAAVPVITVALLTAGCAAPTMLVPDLTSEPLEGLANALQLQPAVSLKLIDSSRVASAASWQVSNESKFFVLQKMHSFAKTDTTGVCEIEAIKPSSLNDHEIFYAIGRGLISCIGVRDGIDFNFRVAASKAKNHSETRLRRVPAWQFRVGELTDEIEAVSSPRNINWQLASPYDLYVLANTYKSAGIKHSIFDKKLLPLSGVLNDSKCDITTAAPTGADDYGVFWSAGIQFFSCIYPKSIPQDYMFNAEPTIAAAKSAVAELKVKSFWRFF